MLKSEYKDSKQSCRRAIRNVCCASMRLNAKAFHVSWVKGLVARVGMRVNLTTKLCQVVVKCHAKVANNAKLDLLILATVYDAKN